MSRNSFNWIEHCWFFVVFFSFMSMSIRKMLLLQWSSGLSPSPSHPSHTNKRQQIPPNIMSEIVVFILFWVSDGVYYGPAKLLLSPPCTTTCTIYIQILGTYSLHVVEEKSFVTIACYKMPTERKVSSHSLTPIVGCLDMCLFSHLLTNGSWIKNERRNHPTILTLHVLY